MIKIKVDKSGMEGDQRKIYNGVVLDFFREVSRE